MDSSGSEEQRAARQHNATQAVFGEDEEDFQATQLNAGESFATLESPQRVPLDSQLESQHFAESQLSSQDESQFPSSANEEGARGSPRGRVRDSQDIFLDNTANADSTQIADPTQIADQPGNSEEDGEPDMEELFGEDVKLEKQEEEVLVDNFMDLDDLFELPKLGEAPAAAEDDELDLFGEISEEEIEAHAEKVQIRKRQQIEDKVSLFKIPPIMSFQARAFDRDEELDALEHLWEEKAIAGGQHAIQLKNPENTFRWRFARDKKGQPIQRDDGLPVYESNTRIVEFDDGSRFLVLGDEYFRMTEKKDARTHLFSEQEDNVYVYHKALPSTLGAVPLGLGSSTHNRLMNSQINKVQPDRRIIQVTKHQVAERQQRYLQDQEADKKLKRIQNEKPRAPKSILSADFLEGDDGGQGPSLKQLKRGDDFLQKASKTLRR